LERFCEGFEVVEKDCWRRRCIWMCIWICLIDVLRYIAYWQHKNMANFANNVYL